MKKYYWLLVSIFILSPLVSCNTNGDKNNISIDNGKLKLSFSEENGSLLAFRDMVYDYQFLDEKNNLDLPWAINFYPGNDVATTNEITPLDFKYSKPDALSLVLEWSNFKEINNKDFQVTATITLDKEKALSYWKISLDGIKGSQIKAVNFPLIHGLKNLEQEKLAVPTWMGQLLDNPRGYLSESTKQEKKMEWEYPGPLSMQCLTLYNPDKIGLYAASNDTLAYRKSFSFALDNSENLTYQMSSYPAFNTSINTYEPSYEAVLGSFKGDWIDAAEQYREWGTKQKWATDSRLKKGLTPKWLEETALWAWNRGSSDNVLIPATDLKQRLGLPVNVFWHWWHGCSYDEGFPEYFPPREGKQAFIKAVSAAKSNGIHSIVYMNSIQWGDATQSWKTENASVHAVRDINGDLRSHAYNIFTGNTLTNMCMATQFWKDKYTSLSESAVNAYGTNGVYMDQACLNKVCYNTDHGHSPGGGNYWMNNFGKLTEQIRSQIAKDKNLVLAGEGGGESWMPYLNLFLTLQVSRERYAGVDQWETIPFYQAVYHQYAITYGNYSSLVTPPYDELWPEEFAPKNKERPLDTLFNEQFLMEQARSFVWGLQPTISNYHSFLATERKEEIDYLMNIARVRYKGLKYLLYGKFLRAPYMEVPEKELDISKLSIYAGRKGESVTAFKKVYPLVYSGAWEADDGHIGVALASISSDKVAVSFNMNTEEYKLPSAGEVYIINSEGRKLLTSYSGNKIRLEHEMQPREVCLLEFIPQT